MTVRAKFMFTGISMQYGTAKRLTFTPQYDTSIPEDQRFNAATPQGEFWMVCDNPAAIAQFELGKQYYIDFTPADPAPPA